MAIDTALYANPLPIHGIGDPFVLRASDGYYYCYPTSARDGYRGWRSVDLCEWEALGYVFQRKEDDWAVKTFWAPEVLEADGRFYMYYTGRNAQDHLLIGVAVAENPAGPFVDIGTPLMPADYSQIDASPFRDTDGQVYLYFVRDCSENIVDGVHESHIYGVRLNPDLVSIAGEPVLLTKPEQEWELNYRSEWRWNEGPFVLKRDGKYYLQYSANHFAKPQYSLGYAVSTEPLGPFIKGEDNPVLVAVEREGQYLVSGPGHHSAIASPDGMEYFVIYHSHTHPDQPSGNRQVCIDRMGFHGDGTWFVSGPTLAPQPKPSGAAGLFNASLTVGEVVASEGSAGERGVVDGDIGMGPNSRKYDWVAGTGVGAWVELRWDAPVTPVLLAVYPSAAAERGVKAFDVRLDGKRVASVVVGELGAPGAATLVELPGDATGSLRIEVTALKEGALRAGLAEIMVMAQR